MQSIQENNVETESITVTAMQEAIASFRGQYRWMHRIARGNEAKRRALEHIMRVIEREGNVSNNPIQK